MNNATVLAVVGVFFVIGGIAAAMYSVRVFHDPWGELPDVIAYPHRTLGYVLGGMGVVLFIISFFIPQEGWESDAEKPTEAASTSIET